MSRSFQRCRLVTQFQHFILSPQIWQPKTLWHILIWWEGTGLDWGLQVTVVFFPPPFSAAQQTKHEEVALPLSFPSSKPGMKQEGRVFSYWELVYSGTSKSVGWMPLFERAPWGKQPPGLVQRWQSNNSSRGVFWVLCSIRKQAAWIGLSWQLGWVRKRLKWMEGNGRRNEKERVAACLSAHRLTHKITQPSQILNVSLLEASVFKCLRDKFATVIDSA